MLKIISIIYSLLYSVMSFSQQVPVGDPNTSAILFNGMGDFKNSGQAINMIPSLQTASGLDVSITKKVTGSAYLNNDWCYGYIVLNSGARIDSIQLRYNNYKGELYFIDRGNTYLTEGSYKEFGFSEAINDLTRDFIFKNNYPATGKNTGKTNYQYLGGTSYQLLKLVTKELSEATGLDGQSYFKITEDVNYYVYRAADDTLLKIKKGIAQLQADLPEIADLVTAICAKQKIKCKNEQELITLFSAIKTSETDIKNLSEIL